MTAPVPALAVTVLGAVSVTAGCSPPSCAGARTRELLARLVPTGGQVVSADRLVEDLWAGEPPPNAMTSLQALILAALLWFVLRPEVRQHFAKGLPGRQVRRFGRT